MSTISLADDNMIPGSTYTFQMECTNLIYFPSTGTIQQELVDYGPSFVGNDLQVTTPNFISSVYWVQFTYNGDGSDVISDVASSIIAACKQGGDDMKFASAIPDVAASLQLSLSNIAKGVGDAVSQVTQGASKQVAEAAQNLLTPVEIAVGILAVLVVVVIFTAGKSGGVRVSEFGASVGGH